MDLRTLLISYEKISTIARALDSPLRLRIIKLLSQTDSMNINEISETLKINQSTCTVNIKILENAHIITTKKIPAQKKGTQKLCSLRYTQAVLSFLPTNMNLENKNKRFFSNMPIGLYSKFSITSPCGLLSENGLIDQYDNPSSFHSPYRVRAGLLWFTYGFIEYTFAKTFKHDDTVEQIVISAELCSEYPASNSDWPSDITFSLNGHEVGMWTCPGDFGGTKGRLTPDWWDINSSQFGLLTHVQITEQGTWINNNRVSNVTIEDVHISDFEAMTIRIEVKRDAKNRGGINIFGSSFGNYPQDINLAVDIK